MNLRLVDGVAGQESGAELVEVASNLHLADNLKRAVLAHTLDDALLGNVAERIVDELKASKETYRSPHEWEPLPGFTLKSPVLMFSKADLSASSTKRNL
jgi:hypothetical protein